MWVLRGFNTQFQAQLQTQPISCYLKGLNIVVLVCVGITQPLVQFLSY